MAVFAGPIVSLRDVKNVAHDIDHLAMLAEAQRRIATALIKAGKSV